MPSASTVLLPPGVASLDEQVALELEHVRRKADDLERYIGLAALQDRNETLFYRLLVDNLEEFLPIVYTPTVGLACQHFSHIFRRPRGVWITPDDVGRIDDILRATGDGIRLIVVTDNERILGLGDQGAGGMAIPVGKLALYTAAAGIYPAQTLPVSLDVGTDRSELLDDPLYVGHRAPRLRGPAYDAVVEAFVDAVARVFPTAIVQWEDFKQHNAVRILDRYRRRLPSFNDDMQGTAAVVLAGLLAARRERGGLTSDRFMFVGAGAAAIGIATLLRRELVAEGMDPRAAAAAIVMLDSRGLVHSARSALPDDQRPFAVDPARLLEAGLQPSQLADPVAIARATGATVLIGASACSGAFTEALVREVGLHDPVPIVLPLSNPSACAEARPEDILAWTAGTSTRRHGWPEPRRRRPHRGPCDRSGEQRLHLPGDGSRRDRRGDPRGDRRHVPPPPLLPSPCSAPPLPTGCALSPPLPDLGGVAGAAVVALVRGPRYRVGGGGLFGGGVEGGVGRAMWWPDYVPFEPGD